MSRSAPRQPTRVKAILKGRAEGTERNQTGARGMTAAHSTDGLPLLRPIDFALDAPKAVRQPSQGLRVVQVTPPRRHWAALAVVPLLAACGTSTAPAAPSASETPNSPPPSSAAPAPLVVDVLVVGSDAIAMIDQAPAACVDAERTRGVAAGTPVELLDASGRPVASDVLRIADYAAYGLEKPPAGACLWSGALTVPADSSGPYQARAGGKSSELLEAADLSSSRFVIALDPER